MRRNRQQPRAGDQPVLQTFDENQKPLRDYLHGCAAVGLAKRLREGSSPAGLDVRAGV
jgi:hypothetical protein